MASSVRTAVDSFIDDVGAIITDVAAELASFDDETLRKDVAVDAYNLVCAFIDCDNRHGNEEIWALIDSFASRINTKLAGATPDQVRASGLLDDKSDWLEKPSMLFGVLAGLDRKKGTSHTRTYYLRAMAVAHAVASIDTLTSEAELAAIERYRSILVAEIRSIEKNRPTVTGPGGTARTAAAGGGGLDEELPPEEPLPPARPLDELFDELDELIGLDAVKREIRLVADLIAVQKLREERGMIVPETTRHLVFTGNPGTGKTTVARLIAQIYRSLGVVDKGHLIETDRAGLVAGFIGQTATRTIEMFDRADQGVLLVDEAYALARGGEKDFGREAIDTMVKLIEDRRDRLVVIITGYPAEMADLTASNPGIESRFPRTIHFDDYTTDELLAIFDFLSSRVEYHADDEAKEKLKTLLDAAPRGRGFGNGRLARNMLEETMSRHASRIARLDSPTDDELRTITADDIPSPDGTDDDPADDIPSPDGTPEQR